MADQSPYTVQIRFFAPAAQQEELVKRLRASIAVFMRQEGFVGLRLERGVGGRTVWLRLAYTSRRAYEVVETLDVWGRRAEEVRTLMEAHDIKMETSVVEPIMVKGAI